MDLKQTKIATILKLLTQIWRNKSSREVIGISKREVARENARKESLIYSRKVTIS